MYLLYVVSKGGEGEEYERRGRQQLPKNGVMSSFKELTQAGMIINGVFQKPGLGYNCRSRNISTFPELAG